MELDKAVIDLKLKLKVKTKERISKLSTKYNRKSVHVAKLDDMGDLRREDFDFLQDLGKGAYGTVFLVQHKKTKPLFALKELSKEMVVKYNKI